jgi:hypothetical protein
MSREQVEVEVDLDSLCEALEELSRDIKSAAAEFQERLDGLRALVDEIRGDLEA